MIRVGLGQAEGIDARRMVERVIAACDAQMGGRDPRAGIVFAGSGFDHPYMLDRINDAFPGMELIGCTTAGEFSTAHGFSDDSITLVTIASDEIQFGAGVGRGLADDMEHAVHSAVETARGKIRGRPALCLTFPAGWNITLDSVIKSLGAALGADCPIFGGASGDQGGEKMAILQFYGREVLKDALPVLLISDPVQYAFSIAHSWRPVGKRAAVTGARDRVVYSIDERSAVEFYRHYLGPHDEPAREFVLAVYEPGRDDFFLCAPIDYGDDGGITFTDVIPEGAEVQLTEAIRDALLQDTFSTTRQLNDAARDWEPALALAFSCAFRKEILGTAAGRELAILRSHLTPHLPISGFYSFGEIGPLAPGGESRAHGATLITLLIGPKADPAVNDEAAYQARTAPDHPGASPVMVDIESENAFLKRKLERSDAYRQRLESIKDYNSRMHRTFMEEIEAARRKLQEKEAALRKSEEKFRRIVQTTGEGFLLMDESLSIVDANDAYCRMLGYSRSDLIGKTPMDLAATDFRHYLASNREKLLAKEQRRIEGELAASDGRHVPVLVHGNTLRDDHGEIIGHMAFVTDMTEQKKALALAGEVQKNLLPRENPRVPGLDVAGRNISCDEIGGDYYDFFWRRETPRSPFSVVVGDITGHGVDAALLMTSARAFLRMHASRSKTITRIVNAMNRHLADDVLDSGRFMTLFCLSIAPDLNSLEWVRAGHDPAILYDPGPDVFDELKGPGLALGVDSDFSYDLNRKTGLRDGQIIAIGTDGIWEAANTDGEMFGKKRFKALLSGHAAAPAADILNAVFSSLDEFTRGKKSEDDITLVIIKIQKIYT